MKKCKRHEFCKYVGRDKKHLGCKWHGIADECTDDMVRAPEIQKLFDEGQLASITTVVKPCQHYSDETLWEIWSGGINCRLCKVEKYPKREKEIIKINNDTFGPAFGGVLFGIFIIVIYLMLRH